MTPIEYTSRSTLALLTATGDDVAGGADAACAAGHGFGLAAWAGGFGVTRLRHDDRAANTPW